jgi:hypothetical protein
LGQAVGDDPLLRNSFAHVRPPSGRLGTIASEQENDLRFMAKQIGHIRMGVQVANPLFLEHWHEPVT